MHLWRHCWVPAAVICFVQHASAAPPTLQLDLLVRVARCDGKPVKPASWIKAHLTAAQKIFAPHGIALRVRTQSFSPGKCELITRADRDGLARHARATGGRAVVLVVKRAQDVDLPSYNLMGVHWRYGGENPKHKGRRWVILTARARPPVLAHELCHYLGLRHDPAGGNLMTPGPSDPIWRRKGRKPARWKPILTVSQAKTIRGGILRRAFPSVAPLWRAAGLQSFLPARKR